MMELNITDELLARTVGWAFISYLKQNNMLESLAREAQSDAVRALEQIQLILNNNSLSDSECFQRIERITETFYAYGLSTTRHDSD